MKAESIREAMAHAFRLITLAAELPAGMARATVEYTGTMQREAQRLFELAGVVVPAPPPPPGQVDALQRQLDVTDLHLALMGIGDDLAAVAPFVSSVFQEAGAVFALALVAEGQRLREYQQQLPKPNPPEFRTPPSQP